MCTHEKTNALQTLHDVYATTAMCTCIEIINAYQSNTKFSVMMCCVQAAA